MCINKRYTITNNKENSNAIRNDEKGTVTQDIYKKKVQEKWNNTTVSDTEVAQTVKTEYDEMIEAYQKEYAAKNGGKIDRVITQEKLDKFVNSAEKYKKYEKIKKPEKLKESEIIPIGYFMLFS